MAMEKKVSEAERILSQNPQSEEAIKAQQKPKVELSVPVKSVLAGMVPKRPEEQRGTLAEDPVKIFLNGAQQKDKPLTSQQMGGIITVGTAGPDLVSSALKEDQLRQIVQKTTLFTYFYSSPKPTQKEASV